MSLRDKNAAADNNNAGDQNQSEPQSRDDRASTYQPRSNNPEKKMASFYDLRDDAPTLTSASSGGEMNRFVEVARQHLKDNATAVSKNGTLSWIVVPASGNDTEMELDAVVIAARLNDTGEVYAATGLFVGSRQMPKQPINIGRDTVIRFTTTANDQYVSDGYLDSLNKQLAKVDGQFNGEVTHIGSYPILNEQLSDQKIIEIFTAAFNQVDFYIRSLTETSSFQIESLNLDNSDLIADIAFQQGELTDPVTELPHRSDVAINVTLVPREDRRGINANVLSRKTTNRMAAITGHVDLVYVGPEKEQRSSILRRNSDQNADVRIYGANLIISNLVHRALPEHMIFAMAQIPALIREQVLIQGLRPTTQKGSLRTVQSLTYELNEEVEELPEVLDDKLWLNLAGSLIREDSQFVTLQVARSGINSPLHRLIVDACDAGNPNRRDSAEILIAAADKLTGNRFSAMLSPAEAFEIGETMETPVLLGTWVDENKQIRDLREIGYFEILSHYGQKSPETVEIWERCQYDSSIDIQSRMDQMEKIIDDFTGGTYRVVDRADVVEINPDWLFALTDACSAAGMVVTTDGINQDTSAYRRGYSARYTTNGYEGKAFRTRGRVSYGFGRR